MSILAHGLRAAAGNTGGGGGPIEYISSNYRNATSSDNVTVTAPSGIEDGDLLVAYGYTRDSSTGTPSCSGFTLHADNDYSFVMSKIASSESGDYTFNWTSTAFNVSISLSVYRNASNIAVGSFETPATSNTSTAPSMTATAGGIIAYFGMDGTKSTSSTITDYTRRVTTSGSSSQASYDNLSVPSGSTGDLSITWNSSAVNTAIQVNIY